jgi:hypothetical protein
VCVLLTDLSDLTPNHQARLQTWEQPADGLHPHPLWWATVCGDWIEHIGPFDKILAELHALNEIWTLIHGEELFKTTDRPREWGWVLRPSSLEWDRFVLLTDQLISDNINTKALTAAGAPTENDAGQTLGTLGRLEAYLTRHAKGGVQDAFKALKDVRKMRNPAAHRSRPPINDDTLVVRQRDLLFDLADSLAAVRRFMSTHPRVPQQDGRHRHTSITGYCCNSR